MNPEDVVTSMCLSCGIPTVISGVFGNLPFVMAPGLGLSAYLTYGLVALDENGVPTKGMTWQETMGCILIAGVIMAFLTVTDLVTKSMKFVPGHIKLATIIGIGLLLATIGFESAGVIVKGELSDAIITQAAWPTWAAMAGLLVIAVLNYWQLPGAIVMGVISVSLVLWWGKNSWPTKVVEIPAIDDTWMKFSLTTLKPETAVPAVGVCACVTRVYYRSLSPSLPFPPPIPPSHAQDSMSVWVLVQSPNLDEKRKEKVGENSHALVHEL